MHTYMIIDRGAEHGGSGNRFVMASADNGGTSMSSSDEAHIDIRLLGHVPSRHLVEELARRVNCHVVVDDDPDPLTVDEPEVPCTCIGVGTLWSPTPGEHHQRDCILYLPPSE